MIRTIVFVCIFASAFASSINLLRQSEEWSLYKKAFNKVYEAHEDARRMKIFIENVKFIEKHNKKYEAKKTSFSVGVNEFADMTTKEFVKLMNGYKMSNKTSSGSSFIPPSNVDIPDTVDWRTKGLVTPVKNQQQCGSCWAFSSTGSLEGQHKKKTGKLVSLSEQNLVDCSGKFGNNGCEGGLMDNSFRYIKANDGIDTEQSYPYEAKDDVCRFKKANVGATDTGYVDIAEGDETALKKAAATIGPISVAIDAGHPSFQLYKNGVYDEPSCSSTQLDHGVLVVGYGTESSSDYWLVKNSWGAGWGMSGYIKMTRNKSNQCGIATKASYPLV